jgi:ubiquinone/menaquinone biosynthesis C-methylase UbiE
LEASLESTTWKAVWERRTVAACGVADADILEDLIKADGFDTGMGDYSVSQWRELTKHISELLKISQDDSVLEVGCGSGAFLYCLNKLTGCTVAGIDYSAPLVETAEMHVPGRFQVSDANALPFPDGNFDIVISHSVFQYFPNTEYASEVLSEIHRVLKRGGKGCLMDLNDKECEASYHEDRRKLYKNPEDYDNKYATLRHLFFDKTEFVRSLQTRKCFDVKFFPHYIPEYLNSRFRFNLTFQKA